MQQNLKLDRVNVALGGKPIIRGISFELEQGRIGCLLGPSGCGKTTLLRAIAGFEPVSSGSILLGNELLSEKNARVATEQRAIGMVFQDYALFPHLTVRENIVFGLHRRKSADSNKRVSELAELLELAPMLDEYPHHLSGGQQQRVAIARAMAPHPRVLLLDEPFASLDVELREQIAGEIREVLKQEQVTAILVSHNQLEAFAMADEIGVMQTGKLLQWDDAFNLYHRPVSPSVAAFVGEGVLVQGTVSDRGGVDTALGYIHSTSGAGLEPGISVSVLLRPDDVIHDDDASVQATVIERAFRGAQFLYTLAAPGGERFFSLVPSHHNHAPGEKIGYRLEVDHLVAFPDVDRQDADLVDLGPEGNLELRPAVEEGQ